MIIIKIFNSYYINRYKPIYDIMDSMISFTLLSSEEVAQELATRLRGKRLEKRLTLEGLSNRSGVALGTLKRFERTGQIGLVAFIKLVSALGDVVSLENLLQEVPFKTLDDVLDQRDRPKRGRIK